MLTTGAINQMPHIVPETCREGVLMETSDLQSLFDLSPAERIELAEDP